MRAAVDTDAFCKLGGFSLLGPAVRALGGSESQCLRLPRLVRQLERASWLGALPPGVRSTLRDIAGKMSPISPRDGGWFDRLANAALPFDAGEAMIFSLVADGDAEVLITGDKRALRALSEVPELACALRGRVVPIEQAALLAVEMLGDEEVKRRVELCPPVLDQILASCLRSPDRRSALRQYVSALENEVSPGLFWNSAESE